MEFFRIHRTIPFMRHALVLNIISLVTFVAAVFFILTRGFHLSIEFTGGTVMEVNYAQTAQLESVRGVVSKLGYTDFQVQNFGTSHDVMIRLPDVYKRQVLRLVQDDEGMVQRAAAHVGQRGDLDGLLLEQALHLLEAHQVIESVVQLSLIHI